jgi:hypothetical protein
MIGLPFRNDRQAAAACAARSRCILFNFLKIN